MPSRQRGWLRGGRDPRGSGPRGDRGDLPLEAAAYERLGDTHAAAGAAELAREAMQTTMRLHAEAGLPTGRDIGEIERRRLAARDQRRRHARMQVRHVRGGGELRLRLHPDRAPTIVAGMAMLRECALAFGIHRIEVSEHDILRGGRAKIDRASVVSRY